MGMRLSGKTALVTGATSNIGRAIAERFAEEGAFVAVSGRDSVRGAVVVDTIVAAGGQASSSRPISTEPRPPPGTWPTGPWRRSVDESMCW